MKCQLCLIHEGKHKVQVEGLCGDHAEQIKEILTFWQENKEILTEFDLGKASKKFGKEPGSEQLKLGEKP